MGYRSNRIITRFDICRVALGCIHIFIVRDYGIRIFFKRIKSAVGITQFIGSCGCYVFFRAVRVFSAYLVINIGAVGSGSPIQSYRAAVGDRGDLKFRHFIFGIGKLGLDGFRISRRVCNAYSDIVFSAVRQIIRKIEINELTLLAQRLSFNGAPLLRRGCLDLGVQLGEHNVVSADYS